MNKLFAVVLGPLLLLVSSLSSAATVFSQPLTGPPGDIVLYSSQNDPGVSGSFAKVYDNFSLANTTSITDVHWYGGFFNGSPAPISSFLIEIWADSSGAPDTNGASLYSATITGDADQTAVDSVVYEYNVDLATFFLAQANTTYWLSIQPTVVFPPTWGWATSTSGVSYQDLSNLDPEDPVIGRVALNVNMAFSLTSATSTVPEPGSLALAGLALAGVFAASRVKKAT